MMIINNRYLNATQGFKGKKNVTPPDPSNGLSLYEYTLNMELSKVLKDGWALSVDLPFLSNTAVDKVEHGSGVRHSTSAVGIGDIRFTAYKWLLSTNRPRKGNIQVGLGLKFPTGNYHSVDYFYYDKTNPSNKILAPVAVAIQLGDGGTGITTEFECILYFQPLFKCVFQFLLPDQSGECKRCIQSDAGGSAESDLGGHY